MPYRHAHWFILLLFPLAGLAFWRNYLSQFAAAPMQFHLHGMSASLWLILLIAQSWTIHHGRRAQHRAVGMASLAIFPLFLAGGIGIFIGMAQRLVEGVSPFYTMYAARLAWLDIVGVAGFAFFYFEALRLRHKVHLHSRYLLATSLFLLPPILGRLAPILPPLAIAGPQDFWKLGIAFQLGNAITAAIALTLAVRSGRDGRPFYLAAILTVVGAVLYQTVGGMAAWDRLFRLAADLPILPLSIVAICSGAAIGWGGWISGRRPPSIRAQAMA